jgi:hypothetical protein
VAKRHATKTHWDWSAAGDETREEDTHEYLKIKGSFVYRQRLQPEYYWYSGTATRYLLGDQLSDEEFTDLNKPRGDIDNPDARIWPFKVHRATQPYDTQFNYLSNPHGLAKDGSPAVQGLPFGRWTDGLGGPGLSRRSDTLG